MDVSTWINIIAVLLGPIVAVYLTRYLAERSDKRKAKMEAFKTLMISRVNALNREFVSTVNSIDVIFYDSPKVRKAWRELYEQYDKPKVDGLAAMAKYTKLIEAIAKDLGYKKMEWNEILNDVYIPNWLTDEWEKERTVKEGQVAMAQMINNLANTQPTSQNNSENK